MTKTKPFFLAALSATVVSFAGAAMAAGAQPGQLAQTSQPGVEAPPGGYQPEREGGVPPHPNGIGRPGASADQPGALQMQEGMEVVNAEGEKIGEVSGIEGDRVIISTGGFLGMGAREVAVDPDRLHVFGTGEDAKLQTTMTQEELERLPAYESRYPAGREAPPGGYQPEREGGAPPPTNGGGQRTP